MHGSQVLKKAGNSRLFHLHSTAVVRACPQPRKYPDLRYKKARQNLGGLFSFSPVSRTGR